MSDTVTFEISQDILDSARLTALDLKLEIAILLYSQGRLSVGKACELADLSLWEFRQLLATRHIAVHYDFEEFHDDLSTVNKLNNL